MRMNKLMKQAMGLEDQVVNIEIVPQAEDPIEQTDIEVQEEETEVAEASNAGDQLEDAAASLEALLYSMEEALEEGGMEPQSSIFADAALADVKDVLGVEPEECPLPALEAFGGTMDKRAATVASMEAVEGFAGKVWQGIKNVFFRLVEMVGNLFAKIMGGFKKIGVRAKEIGDKAFAAKGEKKETTGEISTTAGTAISLNGEVSPASIAKGLENTSGVAKFLADVYFPNSLKVFEGIRGAVAKFKDKNADGADKGRFEKIAELLTDALSTFPTTSGSPVNEGTEIVAGLFLNSISFTLDLKTATTSDDTDVKYIMIGSKQGPEAAPSVNADHSMPALTLQEIIDASKHIEAFCAQMESRKDVLKKHTDEVKKQVTELDKEMTEAGESKIVRIYSRALMSSIGNMIPKNTAALVSAGFRASRAALTIAERSLATVGKEAAAA